MTNIIDCLKYSVGLSTKSCNCYDPKPTNWDKSLSGYYIDDMENGIPLEYPASTQDCGSGSVWDLLEQARISGINEFYTSFLVSGMKYADPSMIKMRGLIGDDKNTMPLSISSNVVGIVLKPNTLRGGTLYIEKLHLTMAGVENIEVKIYRSDNTTTPLITQTISTLNNVKVSHTFTTPLQLPFTDDFGNPLKYYIVYQRTNNVLPRNTVFNCGCGSVIRNWDTYIQGQGLQLNALGDLTANTTGIDGYTYGIQLEGIITCDAIKWLCASDFDYQTNGYFRTIAKSVQLFSINKLIGYMLNSAETNRYTILSREKLLSTFNDNQKIINQQTVWLGRELLKNATNFTDCFVCPVNNIYAKQAILN